MSIEIANESGVDLDTDAILAVARHALDEMGVNPLAELSVLLVDLEYMTELNHRWMGGDGPTDVLAFTMDEGSVDHGPGEGAGAEPTLLGDIVLCPDVAAKQATNVGHSTADELHLLTVHGVLHLLGYDHAEPEEEREMFGLQARLLSGWQAKITGRAAEDRPGAADAADPA
ncbi:MAG TPA: rRNA maturation RNase YbeY [Rugosimonospora sp.]